MQIKIEKFRKCDKGSMLGFFNASFDDQIIVTDLRLVRAGDGYFVGAPQRKYTDKEGKDKWADIVKLTKPLNAELTAAALRYVNEGAPAQPTAAPEPAITTEIPF